MSSKRQKHRPASAPPARKESPAGVEDGLSPPKERPRFDSSTESWELHAKLATAKAQTLQEKLKAADAAFARRRGERVHAGSMSLSLNRSPGGASITRAHRPGSAGRPGSAQSLGSPGRGFLSPDKVQWVAPATMAPLDDDPFFGNISNQIKTQQTRAAQEVETGQMAVTAAVEAIGAGELDEGKRLLRLARASYLRAGKTGAAGLLSLRDVKVYFKDAKILDNHMREADSFLATAKAAVDNWDATAAIQNIREARVRYELAKGRGTRGLSKLESLEKDTERVRVLASHRDAGERAVKQGLQLIQAGDLVQAADLLVEADESFAHIRSYGAVAATSLQRLEEANSLLKEARRQEDERKKGEAASEAAMAVIQRRDLEAAKEYMEQARRSFERAGRSGRFGIARLGGVQRAFRDAQKREAHRKEGEMRKQEAAICLAKKDLPAARHHVYESKNAFLRAGMAEEGAVLLAQVVASLVEAEKALAARVSADTATHAALAAFDQGQPAKARLLMVEARTYYEKVEDKHAKAGLASLADLEQQLMKNAMQTVLARWSFSGLSSAMSKWKEYTAEERRLSTERDQADTIAATARLALMGDQLDRAEQLLKDARDGYIAAEHKGEQGLEKAIQLLNNIAQERNNMSSSMRGHQLLKEAIQFVRERKLAFAKQKWAEANECFKEAGKRGTDSRQEMNAVARDIQQLAMQNVLNRWQKGCLMFAFAAWDEQTEKSRKLEADRRAGDNAIEAARVAIGNWQLETATQLLAEARDSYSSLDDEPKRISMQALEDVQKALDTNVALEAERARGDAMLPQLQGAIERWELDEAAAILVELKKAYHAAGAQGSGASAGLKQIESWLKTRQGLAAHKDKAQTLGDEAAACIGQGSLDKAARLLEEAREMINVNGVNEVPGAATVLKELQEVEASLEESHRLDLKSHDLAAEARAALHRGDLEEGLRLIQAAEKAYTFARKAGAAELLQQLASITSALTEAREREGHRKAGDDIIARAAVAVRAGLVEEAASLVRQAANQYGLAHDKGAAGWTMVAEVEAQLAIAGSLEEARVEGERLVDIARDQIFRLRFDPGGAEDSLEEAIACFNVAQFRGLEGLETVKELQKALKEEIDKDPTVSLGTANLDAAVQALKDGLAEEPVGLLVTARAAFSKAGGPRAQEGLAEVEELLEQLDEQKRAETEAQAQLLEKREVAAREIGALLPRMNKARYDPGMQMEGLVKLSQLAQANAAACARVLLQIEGAWHVIQHCVKAHEKDPALQAQVLKFVHLLSSVSSPDTRSVAKNVPMLVPVLLDAMRTHPQNKDVQLNGCAAVAAFTALLPSSVLPAVGSAGGVSLILRAMRDFQNDAQVQDQGCSALSILLSFSSSDPPLLVQAARDNCAAVASVGGHYYIIAGMAAHPTDTGVLARGCSALKGIALGPSENKTALKQAGVVKAVMAVLRDGELEAKCEAMACLQVLAHGSRELAVDIVEEGAVATCVSTMTANKSARARQYGSRLLASIAQAMPEHRDSMVEDGSVRVVVAAMLEHGAEVALQQAGCAALTAHAVNHPKIAEVIFEAGGLAVVTQAMRAHIESAVFQEQAAKTLQCLGEAKNSIVDSLTEEGVVRAVFDSMRKHVDCASVHEAACQFVLSMIALAPPSLAVSMASETWAVTPPTPKLPSQVPPSPGVGSLKKVGSFMSSGSRRRPTFLRANSVLGGTPREPKAVWSVAQPFKTEEGSLDIVLRALAEHSASSAELLQCGSEVAVRLALASNSRKDDVLRVASSLSDGMKNHGQHAVLQFTCCKLLGELWQVADVPLVTVPDVRKAVLGAMRGFPDDRALQREACRTLCGCIDGAVMLEPNLSSTLISSIKRHGECVEMARWSFAALCLARQTEAADVTPLVQLPGDKRAEEIKTDRATREDAQGGEAVLLALSGLDTHKESAEACEQVLRLLAAVAWEGTHTEAALGAGAVPACLSTMRRHPLHSGLQAQGCQVLSAFAFTSSAGRSEISQAKGLECVLQAMSSLSLDAEVQAEACGALVNLAFASNSLKLVNYFIWPLFCVTEGHQLAVEADAITSILLALRAHPSDLHLRMRACRALKNLLLLDQGQEAALKGGATDTILTIMSSHPLELQLQCDCATILGLLSLEADAIHEGGGVDMLLTALQIHSQCDELVGGAVGALWSIVENLPRHVQARCLAPTMQALTRHGGCEYVAHTASGVLLGMVSHGLHLALVEDDGLATVIAVMESQKTASLVQQNLCAVIAAVVCSDVMPRRESHILRTVLAAMAAHPAVVGVQQHCCAALMALAVKSPQCAQMLRSEENLGLMMHALVHFPRTSELQWCVCRCLSAVATGEEERKTVAQGGTVAACLVSLRFNINEHRVVESTLRLVCDLCSSVDSARQEAQSPQSLKETLAAIEMHLSDAGVQAQGCRLLELLASQPGTQTEQHRAAAVNIAVAALTQHPGVWQVGDAACGLIMGTASPQNGKQGVVSPEAVGCVIRCLKAHERLLQVVEKGCGALCALAQDDTNRLAIMDKGGPEVLVSVIERHKMSAGVVSKLCACLWNLCAGLTAQTALAAEGSLAVIMDALSNHHTDLSVVTMAAGALGALVKDHLENATLALKDGAVSLLLRATAQHTSDAAAQASALAALASFATGPEGSRTVCAEKGLEVVADAMRLFPSDVHIQANGCWALAGIATQPHGKVLALQSPIRALDLVNAALALTPPDTAVQDLGTLAYQTLTIENPVGTIIPATDPPPHIGSTKFRQSFRDSFKKFNGPESTQDGPNPARRQRVVGVGSSTPETGSSGAGVGD